MLSRKLTQRPKLLVLTALLGVLSGCSGKLVFYPIQPTDFYVVEEGERKGDICMSEFYFNEVLNAKIDSK